MKLPDTNVLLYAVDAQAAQHGKAVAWLEAAYASPNGVGFAWLALIAFIRLTTRQGILPKPLSVDDALGLVRDWLAHPHARILQPTDAHERVVGGLLRAAGKAGNLSNDAHLAALAIEHGATLASFDRDFDRFDGLDFERLRV